MSAKSTAQAALLLKLTGLEDHDALKGSDPELGSLNWENFGAAVANKREYIILEVFRFLITKHSAIGLKDLAQLSDEDYEAVTLALHSISDLQKPLEENIN
jgi:hypothetical protein